MKINFQTTHRHTYREMLFILWHLFCWKSRYWNGYFFFCMAETVKYSVELHTANELLIFFFRRNSLCYLHRSNDIENTYSHEHQHQHNIKQVYSQICNLICLAWLPFLNEEKDIVVLFFQMSFDLFMEIEP